MTTCMIQHQCLLIHSNQFDPLHWRRECDPQFLTLAPRPCQQPAPPPQLYIKVLKIGSLSDKDGDMHAVGGGIQGIQIDASRFWEKVVGGGKDEGTEV